MKRKTHTSSSRLNRKREAWLKKLAEVGPIVRGSLVTAQRGNHMAHQLTVSVKSKTHTVYVPMDMVQEVKEWIKNYRRMQRIIKEENGTQSFRWLEQLPVAEFTSNVLFCREQPPEEDEATNFVWLTNLHLCKNNVQNIAKKGGRLRWKIENEGFNVQKNEGYEMEHPYSENNNGFRIFYILLLIAHYITQLILHSSLIRALAKSFGSARNFARRLAESMRNHWLPDELPLPGQIRFRPP